MQASDTRHFEALYRRYLSTPRPMATTSYDPKSIGALVSAAWDAGRAEARKAAVPWVACSERLPSESDGEVLLRMRGGELEFGWATYWRGASNAFAGWMTRDPDATVDPTHWMPIPQPPEA